MLVATGEESCAELAAELHCRDRVLGGWPALARRFPDRFPRGQGILEALDELRRYRRLDTSTLDAIARYLESGDRAELDAIRQLSPHLTPLGSTPLDELAAGLPLPPIALDEREGRILEILLHARAWGTIARWLEDGTMVETHADAFAGGREALLAHGLGESELLALLGSQATRFRSLRGVSSLGRHLLALSEAGLVELGSAQIGSYHLAAMSFVAEEAPARLLPVLETLRSATRPNQGPRLRILYTAALAADPVRFEPVVAALASVPESLFAEAERASPHFRAPIRGARFDLLRALLDLSRERHAAEARSCGLQIAADATDPRHTEAIGWLLRTFGGTVLDELLALLPRSGKHDAFSLASLLASTFGRSAMPAVEWFLAAAEPSSVLRGAEILIGSRDPAFDPRIEEVLGRLLASKDPATLVSAIGLAERWGFDRTGERIWGLLENASKLVRGRAARAIAGCRGLAARDRAVALLSHKLARARLGAVLLLRMLADRTPVGELFEERLDLEPSEEVRDELFRHLREIRAKDGREITLADLERRIARARVRDPIAPWLDLERLPPLHLSDGRRLGDDAVRYLLHRQSRVRGIRPDLEAETLYARCDRARSGDFALAILDSFLHSGAVTEEGWALAVAGLLGDERVVPRLVSAIREWIRERRHVFAEYAVQALALQGSDAALLAVDGVALRHATKPKNVGEAATAAFAEAAERQDLTQDELRDRVVPSLGFEPGTPRIVDCAGKPVEVRVGTDFNLAFRDAKSGKALRALPRGALAATVAELKELRELLKEAARAQSLRLENLLVVAHRWSAPRFRARFLEHPLLIPFSIRLVWGAHDPESGALLASFRALEDGSLRDAGSAEVALPDPSLVGIVHPLALEAAELSAWKEALGRSGITPPFPQLDRPVLRIGPELREMDAYCELAGAVSSPEHVKRTAARLSWRRGDTSGGMINDYWKTFPLAKVLARIYLEGMPTVLDFSTSVRFDRLVFSPVGEPIRRLRLGEIPENILSETLQELHRLCGSNPPR